jgi:DNA-binding CsgD family transcriptional regulator
VAVARLRESDFGKALEVLYAVGEVEGAVAFTDPVLQALRELVPCDVVTFHERSAQADRVLLYVGEPLGPVTVDVREAHRRLKHDDPLRPAHGARTLSDVVTLRAFRRTAFYQHVHRPLGVEHMLQLYIEPERTDARLEFDRSEADFSERDRRVLELLLPHFRQSLQAAARRAAGGPQAKLLTAREREVLSHVAEGRTNDEIAYALQISAQTVRKHLENTFDKLGVHTRTAAVAAAFGTR